MTAPENLNLDDLRKKAEAATKGEWDWGTFGNDVGVLAESDLPFCRMRVDEETYEQRLDDAQFIVAAQPQVVIALIDELDAARKRIAELEGALRPFAKASETIERDLFPDSHVLHGARGSSGDRLYELTAGDFRRARTTLNEGKQP